MTQWVDFTKTERGGDILLAWWQELERLDRGGRARLRRAHRQEDLILEPAYQRLYRDLLKAGLQVPKRQLPWVAGLVATVRQGVAGTARDVAEENREGGLADSREWDAKSPVAAQMGDPGATGKAPVSLLRFQRLLSYDEPDSDFYREMRRALALLGNRTNLFDLAQSVVSWNEYTRRRWAYSYYSKAPIGGRGD